MSHIGECRRFCALIGILLLLLSMLGTQFPWLSITEHDEIHSWYFVNSPSSTDIKSDGDIHTANYHMDVYFSLFQAQTCSTFISGTIPNNNNPISLSNQIICNIISFKNLNKIVLDTHSWDNYSQKCSTNGIICAILIFCGIFLFIIINILTSLNSIKKKLIKKNINNINNNNNCRGCLCGVSFFIPLFIFCGIFIYFMTCMEANAKEVLNNFHRTRKSGSGLIMSLIGSIMILIWYILFISGLFCKKKEFEFVQEIKDYSDDDDESITNNDRNAININMTKNKNKLNKKKKPTKRNDKNGEEIKKLNVNNIDMSPSNDSQTPNDNAGAYGDNSWQNE